jgi:hypothetical protein
MTFAGINYLAIVLAAVASYGFGAVWYMSLAKPWLSALGKTEAELKGSGGRNPLPFVIAFVSQLVMAWVLAGLIGHMGGGGLRAGVISAAFCWLGFVITTLATNHGFQKASRNLTLIDGGHWLGVMLIQGAVLGAMGL